MDKFYIIAIVVYILTILIIARLTSNKFKNEQGEKMWKLAGGRSAYWRILFFVSGLITAGIMYILKFAVFA